MLQSKCYHWVLGYDPALSLKEKKKQLTLFYKKKSLQITLFFGETKHLTHIGSPVLM